MRVIVGYLACMVASAALAAPPSEPYCLIDHDAPTGSRIPEWLFACGDPVTAELLYNSNRTPVGLLYGGPR